MGTAHEWSRVLIEGFLFGGFIALLHFPRRKFVQPPRLYWFLYILECVLIGLMFGMVGPFGARAFRLPLVFLTIGIIASMVPLTLTLRRFNRTLPRLAKKPAPFPVPDFLANRKES
jgi:hypothetical protein